MSSETPAPKTPTAMLWTGHILSVLPAALLLMSSVMKLTKSPEVLEGFAKMGWPENVILGLGIVELACVIFYLIPQTAVLGAILLTGYLGGAIATHLRLGEDWYFQFGFGVILWLGLYFRDARVRALIPFRSLRH